MVDISLLEFAVYGFVAYSSVLMLIISTIITPPQTKSLSLARSIYMLLGVIFAFVLMGAGPTVALPTMQSNTTTVSLNTTEVFEESHSEAGTLRILDGSTWMLAHLLIGLMLLIYVIQQVLMLLVKGGKD